MKYQLVNFCLMSSIITYDAHCNKNLSDVSSSLKSSINPIVSEKQIPKIYFLSLTFIPIYPLKSMEIWLNQLKYFLYLRPWINQTTCLNPCKSSWKIIFLFHKISSWKFIKYNKRQWRTSVNFVWVKVLQKFLQLIIIIVNFANLFPDFC